MEISVIIATYNRADVLSSCLKNLVDVEDGLIEWEIVIADNNSTDSTPEIVRTYQTKKNIKYVYELRQGKNCALNRAINFANGKFFIFIDDDIIVSKDWLRQWWSGIARWPSLNVFGGPILPIWPQSKLPRYIDGDFVGPAYGILDPKQEEGPFRIGRPWGGNMGIRAFIFQDGIRFNENVGPSKGSYIMGSETELLLRLSGLGHDAVFLPNIGVGHLIRPEQVRLAWILRRVYRSGKGMAHNTDFSKVSTVFGYPRYLMFIVFKNFIRCVWPGVFSKSKFFNNVAIFCESLGRLKHSRIIIMEKKNDYNRDTYI